MLVHKKYIHLCQDLGTIWEQTERNLETLAALAVHLSNYIWEHGNI